MPSKPAEPAPTEPPSAIQLVGTPHVIASAVRLWVGLAIIFVFAAVAWAVLRKLNIVPRPGFSRLVTPVLGAVPIVVLLPLWHWRTRHLRRALFASRFRLCTNCAYDLSSLAPTGTCPECGETYDAVADVELWSLQGAPYTEPRPANFIPWSPSPEPNSGNTQP